MEPSEDQCIAADVKLGQDVKIYRFVNLYGCEIGDRTRIGAFVEIQKGAKIGADCKISSHSFVCEGVTVEDRVFVGHHVVFINDRHPRATNKDGHLQTEADWVVEPTRIKRGASIGSGSVILCNVTIGENAIIGAGSVVTRDVPANAVVVGNPARILRYCETADATNGKGMSPPGSFSNPGTSGPKEQKQVVGPALSREQFQRNLVRERARADRNEHQFSVLLFDGDALSNARGAKALIDILHKKIRIIDEIGWFDERRIAVLLPYTASSAARTLASEIRRLTMPSPPFCTIYTYPGQWLPEESSHSESLSNSEGENGSTRQGDGKEASTAVVGRPETLFDHGIPGWKRAMDIVISVAALMILSPLFVVVAMTIALVSPGPIFLKQKRVGYQGRPFTMWKFRTMRIGADPAVHHEHFNMLMNSDMPLTKLDVKGDPRIIPMGNIIRRSCLDELPQLINVLCGDMSLVGPRPCLAFAVSQYRLWQRMRCDALPGMTGLWQVGEKNKTTFKQMIRLDIAYWRRRSIGLDVSILLRTVPAILRQLIDAVPKRKVEDTGARGGAPAHSDS